MRAGVRPYTNRDIDFLVAQRARGVPMKVIAEQMGRSRVSVDNAVRRYGLPKMKVEEASHEISVCVPDAVYQALCGKLAPEGIPFSTYCRQLIEKDLGLVQAEIGV